MPPTLSSLESFATHLSRSGGGDGPKDPETPEKTPDFTHNEPDRSNMNITRPHAANVRSLRYKSIMKMSDINHLLPTRLRHLSLSLVAVAGMASCDSVIYDDEGDCSVHYRISFRYVKNMLGADAFGPQVTDINLQVYDQHGKLVLSKSEKRNPTEANDFLMEVDLQPGTYDLLAWCEGESLNPDATRFSISGGGEGNLTGCSASLPLSGSGSDLYSDRDITRLYHGFADDVVFPDTYGQVDIAPLYLTKDTNHITVLIQNLDGSGIDETDLSISLEADNSVIEWNLSLIHISEPTRH